MWASHFPDLAWLDYVTLLATLAEFLGSTSSLFYCYRNEISQLSYEEPLISALLVVHILISALLIVHIPYTDLMATLHINLSKITRN